MRKLVLVWERSLLGIGESNIVVPLNEVTQGQFELNCLLYGRPKGKTQLNGVVL